MQYSRTPVNCSVVIRSADLLQNLIIHDRVHMIPRGFDKWEINRVTNASDERSSGPQKILTNNRLVIQ